MCSPAKVGPPARPAPAAPRDAQQRKQDTLRLLTTPAIDAWVATASPDGAPYVVPLSLAWIEGRVVLALPAATRTARNLAATARARLGVGATRDVVLIDAELDRMLAVDDHEAASVGARYAAQADWDPRAAPAGQVYAVLRPQRIQAWREANEQEDRTLMRDGAWLTGSDHPAPRRPAG
ncbi:pyridoxamine 5'-phosphate oxidase family protein [Ruania albidiflava]|uniref:pyridoxamine 5'-phosphate oxidase family protein n=1 Tax=Ruania albidiflava TaxID=366586 RepID=UPI0023F33DE5|nr:pyridoxamine 5'-phosphate oxidase family protein [Ruania albidiflava]